MTDSRYFRFAVWILLIFLIILVGSHIPFVFVPFIILLQTVFFPILLAGVLYYLMVPIVDRLTERRVPRTISIILIYLGFIFVVTMLVVTLGPVFQRQVMSLIDNAPGLFNEVRNWLLEVQQHPMLTTFVSPEQVTVEEVARRFSEYINQIFFAVVNNISAFLGTLTNFVTTLLMIPFILFYMLKSGDELPRAMIRFLPSKHQDEGRSIVNDMNQTLRAFIQGQIIVSMSVGVLCYIGFLIIGIEYALLLALVAMVTNVIPFIGPFIGTIPALIVGILHSPFMALKVLIVIIVVQQIESLLISPRVMGSKLNIHPVTIILLILVAGNLAGFLGLILAVPTYAIGKVVISHTYRLVRLRLGWD
ncbi:AI-2E family transporter [Desulfuribacillus alkaliarsenatis]|uniref:AI-2E family transporter n=1 Tax=Desulfuribacillus alkaliarsenatis TaxID=766136 RepID=A0A1E5G380_9FIRM|nr:AI-2E family transporter [Desulfuribacillus alkaliarsenatis]OEF97532.1 AI-2E family transporter [Desulfuribacillus alkaliarsenatis]